MGTKRPYSNLDGQGSGPRAHRDGRGDYGPSKKRQRQGKKNFGTEDASTGAMKKRARTIERLLQRQGEKPMPANVQKDLERELGALKQRIQEAQEKKLRSNMISKYHMVRFFERQKAQRLVKKLQKKLGAAKEPDEIAQLEAELHIAQVDVNYAIYHPFLERYVSLYSSAAEASKETGEKPAAELALHAERPPMWKTVEAATKEGERALLRLQNRRPQPSDEDRPVPQKRKTQSQAELVSERLGSAPGTAATQAQEPDSKKPKEREFPARVKSSKKTKGPPRDPAMAPSDGEESSNESDGEFFEPA